MTLPTVPPIGMVEIQQEFSAPLGTPLSAFLRGGVWVPDTSANVGVPTVLPISMLDLLGASAQTDIEDLFDMFAEEDPKSQGTGYAVGQFGTLTPDTYRGTEYNENSMGETSENFTIVLRNGPGQQDFFDAVRINGLDWPNVELLTADATFNPAVNNSWTWNIPGQPPFVDSENYSVILIQFT